MAASGSGSELSFPKTWGGASLPILCCSCPLIRVVAASSAHSLCSVGEEQPLQQLQH